MRVLGLRTVHSTLGKAHLLEMNENEGFYLQLSEVVVWSVGRKKRIIYTCGDRLLLHPYHMEN